MIEVGPRVLAIAYMPKDAAVPAEVLAKFTRTMLRNTPVPQTNTTLVSFRPLNGYAGEYTY